MLFLVGLNVKS